MALWVLKFKTFWFKPKFYLKSGGKSIREYLQESSTLETVAKYTNIIQIVFIASSAIIISRQKPIAVYLVEVIASFKITEGKCKPINRYWIKLIIGSSVPVFIVQQVISNQTISIASFADT